jgi:hypothetical protein
LGGIALATAVGLVPWQCVIWDGGFPDVECRLKFVDREGNAVSGVKLTVLTRGGTVSHFYPVDEFVPDRPVVSDAEGQMVFHHSSSYLEFGGRRYENFLGLGFGEGSPEYVCVFTHQGREVFRTPYNFHRREWEQFRKPMVTRRYSPPWDAEYRPRPDEELDDWSRRLHNGKTRAEMDREERTAAGNFERRIEWEAILGRQPSDLTFIVVERIIVIPNP